MDSQLQDLADKAIEYAIKSGAQYADARAEHQEKTSMHIEDAEIENIQTNIDHGIGIRLIKENVWSFCSITNPKSLEQIKSKIDDAIKTATHYSRNKKNKIRLFPNNSKKTTIEYEVLQKPEIEEIKKISIEYGKIISATPRIIKSIVNPWFAINSKYFVNSEGAEILQNYTDTVIDMVATAHESKLY